MSGLNPITIILIVNSLSVVSLVLTQNDTTKEELSKIIRSYLYSLQKNKQKLRNFFLKESVRYIGQ